MNSMTVDYQQENAILDNLMIGYLKHRYRSPLIREWWEFWATVPCKAQNLWLKNKCDAQIYCTYISI